MNNSRLSYGPWGIRESEYPENGSIEEKLEFFLRYAILAPSSHNTQPWKFAVDDTTVTVFADKTRWLRVADTDQRELYISIGCALENLVVAADHFGYGHEIEYFPDGEYGPVAAVTFFAAGDARKHNDVELFGMITHRYTNHKVFENIPLPVKEMTGIDACCSEDNYSLYNIGCSGDEETCRKRVNELIERADLIQYHNQEFKRELAWWIGQGIFGASKVSATISKLAITYLNIANGQVKKDSKLMLSAPSIMTIVSSTNGRRSQVEAGRIYERVSLAAAKRGMAVHPMSQILEEPKTKVEFSSLLPERDLIPQHMFRLGYAEPEKGHTPRRPLEEVLV